MQKKIFLFIGVAIVAILIAVSVDLTLNDSGEKFNTLSLPELEFTYDESNLTLKQNLDAQEISMSSPIKLVSRNNLDEFCTFFENDDLQSQVEYCTSTELRDSEGTYLGNIHMVGTRQMPKIILALIQSEPFMQNLDSVKTVYSIVIKDLVCDCWNEVQPSGIQTVAEWVDKQRDFHTSDTKPTSKSNLNLSGMQLQMELTTNTQGYLWKLVISG
jgi:hypothetical protein